MVPQKRIILCTLVLLLAAATLLAAPTSAQTFKPATPEFTVNVVDNSYDVPVTYTTKTDPYTGEVTQEKHGGNHVFDVALSITVKNQALPTYTDPQSHSEYRLYFNITYKGHYADTWLVYKREPFKASNEATTTFNLNYGGNQDQPRILILERGGRIDFRVQALYGYYEYVEDPMVPGVPRGNLGSPPHHYVFHGEMSNWAQAQTVEFPNPYPTPKSTATPTDSPQTSMPPTPTATQTTITPQETDQFFELTWEKGAFIAMTAAIALLAAAVTVLWCKISKMASKKSTDAECPQPPDIL